VTRLSLERYMLDDDTARWAASLLRSAQDAVVPLYGSAEWLSAPWRVQVASAVRAAECWRRESLFLPQALEDELAARRYLREVEEAKAFAVVAYSVRRMADTPTHAELVERRAA
jgi:hypothetical protein